VKPLIGKDKDGRPYRRPREVDEEIKAVLEWPLPQAFGLAAEGKLRPQTLVYLLRNFKPNRPGSQYDSLIMAFFSRLQRSGEPLVRELSFGPLQSGTSAGSAASDQIGHLGLQLRFVRARMLIGQCTMLAGIGVDLGPVERNRA
jgi:hypothetical protein